MLLDYIGVGWRQGKEIQLDRRRNYIYTTRRYFPYSARRLPSSEPFQQHDQLVQIIEAEVRAACRDLHKWIGCRNVGVACGKRLDMSVAIGEVHSILAPVTAAFDQFEFLAEHWMEWMGYSDLSMRTLTMRCS